MMDISKADDIRIGSVPAQSAWLGGRKVWDRTERRIMRSMVCWYDIARQGCTNEGMAQNPVLKDLSGNGHDMQCYNFAWSGMSGIGGYRMPFGNFALTGTANATIIDNNETRLWYRLVAEILADGTFAYNGGLPDSLVGQRVGFRVSGIPDGGRIEFGHPVWLVAGSDGEWYGTYQHSSNNTFDMDSYGCVGATVTVEFLPDYPGALVSDGVDDCCFVEGLPTLTDYTVVARRLYSGFEQTGNVNASLASKREAASSEDGAFQFERFSGENIKTFNFGAGLDIKEAIDGSPSVSWQTAGSYNGAALPVRTAEDTQSMSLFCLRKGSATNTLKAALYSLILFDRTLTDEEIEWVGKNLIDKDYVYPPPLTKINPAVYYDFSQGSNDAEDRETVRDLSGNGNDARLYNFGFTGMSGYEGYKIDPSSWLAGNEAQTERNGNRIKVTYESDQLITSSTVYGEQCVGFKVRFIGFGGKTVSLNIVASDNSRYSYPLLDQDSGDDVTVTIPRIEEVAFGTPLNAFRFLVFPKAGEGTIEFLPEYPGALVFDDVDDYGVIIKRGDFEKCTMLMLCTPISKQFGANSILIDTRGNANNIFYINNYPADAIAFPGANVGNICINNIQNNVLTVQQLNNKKVLISRTGAISNEDSNPIYLGTNKYFNAYSGMALYKFLLFDRELTQKEIDKVIQDYHLLDGVDDVWNQ